MKILRCTKKDYLNIIHDMDEFWNSNTLRELHHPFFIHEFGNSALVIKHNDIVIGYLLGFLSQTEPVGYVHLVAVRNGYRQSGYATHLYSAFIQYCNLKGCVKIKAITSPGNKTSISFHQNLGFRVVEPGVIKDYSAPGEDRIVFEKGLL